MLVFVKLPYQQGKMVPEPSVQTSSKVVYSFLHHYVTAWVICCVNLKLNIIQSKHKTDILHHQLNVHTFPLLKPHIGA